MLIFITAGSVMATLYSTGTRTKQSQALEQTINDLQIEFLNAVKWGTSVSYSSNSISVDGVAYQLRDERIYKNDVPLTSNEVIIKSLNVNNYSNSPPYLSLEIKIELGHRRFAALYDTVRFVVSQRKTTLEEHG